MNNKKTNKSKPRGRPQVSTLKRRTQSVTVKFSKPDYEMLRHRSKNANRTLAEYIRDSAFDARIVAKHSAEDAAVIRNLTHGHMPCMKFLFVRPDVCRRLPSDSTSRWTPLPWAMRFPLLGLARDLHPLANAERTT